MIESIFLQNLLLTNKVIVYALFDMNRKWGYRIKQLKKFKESYDTAIEFGREVIDLYKKLPQYIIDDPYYLTYEEMKLKDQLSDSEGKIIKDFLSPF